MKRLLTLSVACLLSSILFSQTAPVQYTMLLAGNRAGTQTSAISPDGAHEYTFEFNDRGRGPKLKSRITLDADGLITSLATTGNEYYKGPVDERFTLAGGKAAWKNRGEQGEQQVNGKAFYISMDSVPEEQALLAEALLKAPNGTLALLPAGQAHIDYDGSLKVQSNGQSLVVRQYEISGTDFEPARIWLDPDGAYFASASGWFALIRQGWESAIPDLLKAQDAQDSKRNADLARRLAHKPAGPLAFTNVNLFDTESATSRPHSTVVITGDRISAVGPDGQTKIPPGAEVIDGHGKALLPGLWDCHVHLSGIDGLMHMAAGVTTVRDMANDTDRLLEMRKHFDEGATIGPRVLMAGIMDGPGPFAGPTKVLVDNEDEARRAIDNYARLGYVQTKIYSSIKPELVPAIVKMSHEHGMRVSGHVPAFMSAEQFINDGVDEIQHVNFLFLNFWFNEVKDTRGPARFTEVAKRAADLDFNSDQVKSFIQLMKTKHIVSDPTIAIFEDQFTARPGKVSPAYAPIADRLPPTIRRGFLTGGLPVPDGMDQRYRDSWQAVLKMVKTLYDNGVTIVAGTDAMAGFALHRELELYHQAGIPAPKVLQLDTLGAARVMKRDHDLGSIAPGKLADLILVNGDPAVNISDIRKVETIVKGGVVYRSNDLYQAIGVKPQ